MTESKIYYWRGAFLSLTRLLVSCCDKGRVLVVHDRYIGKNRSCRKTVVISTERKWEGASEELIVNFLNDIGKLLGLIDATMAALMVIYPTKEEKDKAHVLSIKTMLLWQSLGFSVTLKAHIVDHHICDFNDKHGIGDKDENFIEQRHQGCSKNEDRMKRVANFKKSSTSALPLGIISCKTDMFRSRYCWFNKALKGTIMGS